MQFPFKRNDFTDEDIFNMFGKLQNYKYANRLVYDEYYIVKNVKMCAMELTYIGRPMLLLSKKTDYTDFNILSDMFNEENRMKAKRYDQTLSPWDFFYANTQKVIDYCINKYGIINNHNLRESLYELCPEATSFRPTNLMFAVQFFGSKSVLDFSSGWGDRLIGAMAADVEYTGIDPNINLFPKYAEMIKYLAKDPSKYEMINAPIETAIITKKYDLVFTSPPFFDLEVYTDSPNQSISGKSTEKQWFDEFLKVAINKVTNALNDGGFLVIIINQKNRSENYIHWMIDYAKTLTLAYYGVISYTDQDKKSPQPMWIWQKTVSIPKELYNPPIIIQKVYCRKKLYNIVRDDYLIGGTKQRGLIPFLLKKSANEFVYAGPIYGYAQIALAYCAQLLKKKATVFVEKIRPMHNFTKWAQILGANIVEVDGGYLEKLKELASKYVAEKSARYLLPFGLDDKEFKKCLCENIVSAWPTKNDPQQLWLVAGSATMLNSLYCVFKSSRFFAVQVGKKIWPDQYNEKNTQLIVSNEKFSDRAKMKPPYPSVSNYDAKVWKYVVQQAANNAYVWNVGKDIPDVLLRNDIFKLTFTYAK